VRSWPLLSELCTYVKFVLGEIPLDCLLLHCSTNEGLGREESKQLKRVALSTTAHGLMLTCP
jgi:hypothetical protein